MAAPEGESARPLGDAGPLDDSERIDNFEIRRLIGRGSRGHVYLARDLILGRRVALKTLAPTTRVDALLSEAQVVARLNHPNIVTIHAVSLTAEPPYIAMEHLEGESLEARTRDEVLPETETIRVGVAVAEALAHAHAHGVIHGDLNPSNVFLPVDGRIRVVDFGLARLADDGRSTSGWSGTMAYWAPECLRSAEYSEASDVWALGAMLYELICGQLPFSPAQMFSTSVVAPLKWHRLEVQPQLREIVGQCLTFDQRQRPTAEEVARRLSWLVVGPARDDAIPYVGLTAFGVHQSRLFFGRDAEINHLLERIRKEALLFVTGPSGVGKSSLVAAGLIPRLLESRDWSVVVVRPGAEPLRSLASAVSDSTDSAQIGAIVSELRQRPQLLNLQLHERAARGNSRVLLVIDQLEELFTNSHDEGEAKTFVEAMLGAVDDAEGPLRVVATIRHDFLDRLSSIRSVFVVPPLGRPQLAEAVEGPARRAGYRFEASESVEVIVDALVAEPTRLPVLQVACQELWRYRDQTHGVIPRGALDRLGGIGGVLSTHADRVISVLPDAEVELARQILIRLVSPEGHLRVVSMSSLSEALGDRAASVVDTLVKRRLLTLRRADGTERRPYVSLMHEALIGGWDQLKAWLEENRSELKALDQISRAAELWVQRGRQAAEVWPGEQLAALEAQLGAQAERLSENARSFIALGQAVHRRRTNQRQRQRLAVVVTLAAITLGSLLTAAEFRRREQVTRAQAQQIELAAGDIGEFELSMSMFDWGPEHQPVVTAIGDVEWSLRKPSRRDYRAPGRVTSLIRSTRLPDEGRQRRFLVEARSGPAFLVIRRQGPGESECSPVEVQIRQLPGYAQRSSEHPRLSLSIPSCAASLADTVLVPQGDFVPTPAEVKRAKLTAESDPPRMSLPAYRIDRLEVSVARAAPFMALENLTKIPNLPFPDTKELRGAGAPDRPVLALNAYEAHALCRFYGGRLPTNHEWTKAARGGWRMADGSVNADPTRKFPWGSNENREAANLWGPEDGYVGPGPVTAFENGASPYGLLNMAGNVYEWTATDDPLLKLRITRGGNWASRPRQENHAIDFENVRNPGYVGYSTGVRCVYGARPLTE